MRTQTRAALYGAPIGMLGGLIGLGGAEFRLPVLKAVFSQPTRKAVAFNLAVSLITLVASMLIRFTVAAPPDLGRWLPILFGIIAGSMIGAYAGPVLASRMTVEHLDRWVMGLLIFIGGALIAEAFIPLQRSSIDVPLAMRIAVAFVLGIGIGLISSLLGVAGGEVIIPTLVLLFGADIKTAGTLSVMISLPTVSVGMWRYARKSAYESEGVNKIVLPMGVGSVVGAALGGLLLPFAPAGALKLGLGVILIVSAIRIFRHRKD